MTRRFHFAELHIQGSIIKYKNTLFGNYFLKCNEVKRIVISFNCCSEYISNRSANSDISYIEMDMTYCFVGVKL